MVICLHCKYFFNCYVNSQHLFFFHQKILKRYFHRNLPLWKSWVSENNKLKKKNPDSQRNLWLFIQTSYVEQKNHCTSYRSRNCRLSLFCTLGVFIVCNKQSSRKRETFSVKLVAKLILRLSECSEKFCRSGWTVLLSSPNAYHLIWGGQSYFALIQMT